MLPTKYQLEMSNLFRTTIGSIRWRKKASQQHQEQEQQQHHQQSDSQYNTSKSNCNNDDQGKSNEAIGLYLFYFFIHSFD